MKRRDILKQLSKIAKSKGYELELKEGGNHTKVTIGSWSTVLPRHNEIKENLAKSILKEAKK